MSAADSIPESSADARSASPQSAPDPRLLRFLREQSLPLSLYAEDNFRFSPEIEVLPKRIVQQLFDAHEALLRIMDELVELVARKQELLRSAFCFDELEQAVWQLSALQWKGFTRSDFFESTNGELQCVELNSDTPSGIDDAVVMDAWVEQSLDGALLLNKRLEEAICSQFVDQSSTQAPVVALLYPSDIPEDMGMINLLWKWLRNRGCEVLLCSPHNLQLDENKCIRVFGRKVDIIHRHYKSDWWLQRRVVWRDAMPFPDATALLKPLRIIAEALGQQTVKIVNPFGTLLTQNKSCMALMHELIDEFSEESQRAIRRCIPLTLRLNDARIQQLRAEKEQWVLKSNYGCEGAEVVVGPNVTPEIWQRSLDLLLPQHWIAQRYIDIKRDEHAAQTNYGVYSVGSKACGLYLRRSTQSTDLRAEVVPHCMRPTLGRLRERPEPSNEHLSLHWAESTRRTLQRRGAWSSCVQALLLSELSCSCSEIDLSDNQPSSHNLFNTHNAEQQGSAYRAMMIRADTELRRSVFIMCDLDGVDSLAFASALREDFALLLHINNIAHQAGVIDYAPCLTYIREHESFFNEQFDDAHYDALPGCLVLDARRMCAIVEDEEQRFNNRYLVNGPSIVALQQRGVRHILYIHECRREAELDDLHEDFLAYQAAGIEIHRAALGQEEIALNEIDLRDFLTQTKVELTRRSTPLSYLYITETVSEPTST